MNSSRAKEQVKERIDAITATTVLNAPSAPSEDVVDNLSQNVRHLANGVEPEAQGTPWEDVKELLVLENCMLCVVLVIHAALLSIALNILWCINVTPGGGGVLGKFWVGVCRWDSETLSLYQTTFSSILLPYSRLRRCQKFLPYLRLAISFRNLPSNITM